MKLNKLANIFILSFILLVIPINAITLANDDEVKPLGDILNPKTEYDDDGKAITSASLANKYYKKCINENSLIFDDIEKDILCSCTAAKMSETLAIEDFKNLDKKGSKGKESRGRMLAYSYAPCMEYVVEKKVTTDCYISKNLDDIVVGKSEICKCVSDNFKQFIKLEAPKMITKYMLYEPMGLNPLEDYFKKKDYWAQHKVFMRQCRFKFEYYRDNKR